jgi:exodeoxyribonuclease V gamma subunit
MFTIHQSNSTLVLASLLQRNLISERPSDTVFEPETILVQSYGIATWLKARIAEFQGIAANLDCVLPAEFIWRVYRELPGDPVPETSSFSREAMLWKLMTLLPLQLDHPDYSSLARYLQSTDNKQLRLFQLCSRIASVFDQYLVYRPDWIRQWHSSTGSELNGLPESTTMEQRWQQDLWRKLFAFTESLPDQSTYHRVKLHEMLSDLSSESISADLPHRVSVFGVSSLPPQQLDVLRQISSQCPIDIYLFNPCQMYWGDIVPAKQKAKIVARQIAKNAGLAEEDYLMIGNPLLSSMGQQTREFTDLLLDIPEAQFNDHFIEAQENTILHNIQREILNLEFGGKVEPDQLQTEDKFILAGDDRSIQIHSTHSPLREIEVLLDQLLHMFSQDQSLEPRDVIVMMPDVSSYVPYIDSVFGRHSYGHTGSDHARSGFTYSISDRSTEQESPIITAFFSLLELPSSRLAANDVLDLLQEPAIAKCFNLDPADIQSLNHWISQSGIRWGWDANSKQTAWNLPADEQNTWKFGLDRMLLGYAMDNSAGLFSGVLPLEGVQGSSGALLGRLLRIFELLSYYRQRLSESLSITAWQSLLNDLIEDFFTPDIEEDLSFNQIRDVIAHLADLLSSNRFDAALDLAVVKFCLQQSLQQPGAMHRFLSGGITFCNLVPMRSIPFRIVCLLGMNDADYPRKSPAIGFDLIRLSRPRKGDRSRRNDDRYLFLEALLSAQQTFYLSYQGKSATSNRDRPPSVLVSDLLDSCKQTFVCTDDRAKEHTTEESGIVDQLLTQHPLQPFSDLYFSADHLISYSQDWYDAVSKSASNNTLEHVFCAEPLVPPDLDRSILDIDELCRFFTNPARYFFNNRLGVYYTDSDEETQDTESFNLNNLDGYQLAQDALLAQIEGLDRNHWGQSVTASGRVLSGDMGNFQLDTPWQKATDVYQQIDSVIQVPAEYLPIRATAGQTLLVGEIKPIYDGKYLFYRTGKASTRQRLECWIRHLGLNASGYATDLIISDSNQTVNFSSVDSSLAAGLLSELVSLYFQGLSQPLRFVPELSLEWQQGIHDGKDEEALVRKIATAAKAGRGEVSDPYYQRAFDMPAMVDEEFRELSATVYKPYIKLQASL